MRSLSLLRNSSFGRNRSRERSNSGGGGGGRRSRERPGRSNLIIHSSSDDQYQQHDQHKQHHEQHEHQKQDHQQDQDQHQQEGSSPHAHGNEVIEFAYGRNADLYSDVLGISRDASTTQIQSAFFDRRYELYDVLAKEDELSPTERHFAERRMDAVVAAFRILSNPGERAAYDAGRGGGGGGGGGGHRRHSRRKMSPGRISVEERTVETISTMGMRGPVATPAKRAARASPETARTRDETDDDEDEEEDEDDDEEDNLDYDEEEDGAESDLDDDGEDDADDRRGRDYQDDETTEVTWEERRPAPPAKKSSLRRGSRNGLSSSDHRHGSRSGRGGSGGGHSRKQKSKKHLSTHLSKQQGRRASRRSRTPTDPTDDESSEGRTIATALSEVEVAGCSALQPCDFFFRPGRVGRAIKEEVEGAADDTVSGFSQVVNVFTLKRSDINAVVSEIDDAKRELRPDKKKKNNHRGKKGSRSSRRRRK